MTTIDRIRTLTLEAELVTEWDEMRELVARPLRDSSTPCWEFGLRAAHALGKSDDEAMPGAAAIFSLMISISVLDDILDDDPKGLYHRIGAGRAANIAAAFQATAARILDRAGWPASITAPAQAALAHGAVATAWGQNLDALDPSADEDTYWRIVRAKTPPLYAASFEIGALAAGADPRLARAIGELGLPMGELAQIGDDLHDALQIPAEPDWQRQCTNLPILFARLAEYPERERFAELETRIDQREALEEAQRLLVTSGAVSYCALHMIHSYRNATLKISQLDLVDPTPLVDLFDERLRPLKSLLERCGVDNVEELIAA